MAARGDSLDLTAPIGVTSSREDLTAEQRRALALRDIRAVLTLRNAGLVDLVDCFGLSDVAAKIGVGPAGADPAGSTVRLCARRGCGNSISGRARQRFCGRACGNTSPRRKPVA